MFIIETENKKKFLGLIIRRMGKTKVLMGYFWKLDFEVTDKISLAKSNPLLITIFSGLGFEIGNWKLIGKYPKWDREEWEVPYFKRYVEENNKYYASRYDDNFRENTERRVTKEEADPLFWEVCYGYIALENRLDKMSTSS